MDSRIFERMLLGLVVLAGLTALSANTADPDLWGHVQYGQDWLRDGALPATSTYSFTAEGYPWVNHENLAELAMAWTVNQFGPPGLIVLRALLALATLGMILGFNLRRGNGWMASSVLTLLVAWNLGFHFSYRPQVATMFFLSALLWVVETAFRGWNPRLHHLLPMGRLRGWLAGDAAVTAEPGYSSRAIRLLWLVPPILFLWTNSHGGFLAGLAIYGVLLGLRTVEAFLARGRAGWGLARRFTLMFAAAFAATLLNPYSFDLIRWMVDSVGNHRPEIDDWGSVQLWSGIGLKFWLLCAAVLFSVVASRRPKDIAQLVVLGLVFWQACSHFRHVQVFTILAGFWIGPHLQSAFGRIGRTAPDGSASVPRRVPRWQLGALGLVAAGMVIGLIPRLNCIRVDRREYPVDALQFMVDRKLTGRTVVSFDWAQYFIAAMCAEGSALGPASRVSFDGRFDTCYPREHIDYHFDFLAAWTPGVVRNRSPSSGPFDPTRVLRLGDPELVLNRRIEECSSDVMEHESAWWVLLYQDPIAQVWGQRRCFDDPASPLYLPPERRSIDQVELSGHVPWPALPVVRAGGTEPEAVPMRLASGSARDGSPE